MPWISLGRNAEFTGVTPFLELAIDRDLERAVREVQKPSRACRRFTGF